ncbi:hypothetical protein BLNAU_15045 [Blattamonas nauphoetae]|uniref:HECT-type E3 ubiquitin transferase n=1 Tax=Blattamonas nauphoetae TaxID=2049346 RepID=A0ABQ9XFK7_9EUKA|nr:hypothetical protein BLNAU_15045 [Blattamonas nauphoetae]
MNNLAKYAVDAFCADVCELLLAQNRAYPLKSDDSFPNWVYFPRPDPQYAKLIRRLCQHTTHCADDVINYFLSILHPMHTKKSIQAVTQFFSVAPLEEFGEKAADTISNAVILSLLDALAAFSSRVQTISSHTSQNIAKTALRKIHRTLLTQLDTSIPGQADNLAGPPSAILISSTTWNWELVGKECNVKPIFTKLISQHKKQVAASFHFGVVNASLGNLIAHMPQHVRDSENSSLGSHAQLLIKHIRSKSSNISHKDILPVMALCLCASSQYSSKLEEAIKAHSSIFSNSNSSPSLIKAAFDSLQILLSGRPRFSVPVWSPFDKPIHPLPSEAIAFGSQPSSRRVSESVIPSLFQQSQTNIPSDSALGTAISSLQITSSLPPETYLSAGRALAQVALINFELFQKKVVSAAIPSITSSSPSWNVLFSSFAAMFSNAYGWKEAWVDYTFRKQNKAGIVDQASLDSFRKHGVQQMQFLSFFAGKTVASLTGAATQTFTQKFGLEKTGLPKTENISFSRSGTLIFDWNKAAELTRGVSCPSYLDVSVFPPSEQYQISLVPAVDHDSNSSREVSAGVSGLIPPAPDAVYAEARFKQEVLSAYPHTTMFDLPTIALTRTMQLIGKQNSTEIRDAPWNQAISESLEQIIERRIRARRQARLRGDPRQLRVDLRNEKTNRISEKSRSIGTVAITRAIDLEKKKSTTKAQRGTKVKGSGGHDPDADILMPSSIVEDAEWSNKRYRDHDHYERHRGQPTINTINEEEVEANQLGDEEDREGLIGEWGIDNYATEEEADAGTGDLHDNFIFNLDAAFGIDDEFEDLDLNANDDLLDNKHSLTGKNVLKPVEDKPAEKEGDALRAAKSVSHRLPPVNEASLPFISAILTNYQSSLTPSSSRLSAVGVKAASTLVQALSTSAVTDAFLNRITDDALIAAGQTPPATSEHKVEFLSGKAQLSTILKITHPTSPFLIDTVKEQIAEEEGIILPDPLINNVVRYTPLKDKHTATTAYLRASKQLGGPNLPESAREGVQIMMSISTMLPFAAVYAPQTFAAFISQTSFVSLAVHRSSALSGSVSFALQKAMGASPLLRPTIVLKLVKVIQQLPVLIKTLYPEVNVQKKEVLEEEEEAPKKGKKKNEKKGKKKSKSKEKEKNESDEEETTAQEQTEKETKLNMHTAEYPLTVLANLLILLLQQWTRSLRLEAAACHAKLAVLLSAHSPEAAAVIDAAQDVSIRNPKQVIAVLHLLAKVDGLSLYLLGHNSVPLRNLTLILIKQTHETVEAVLNAYYSSRYAQLDQHKHTLDLISITYAQVPPMQAIRGPEADIGMKQSEKPKDGTDLRVLQSECQKKVQELNGYEAVITYPTLYDIMSGQYQGPSSDTIDFVDGQQNADYSYSTLHPSHPTTNSQPPTFTSFSHHFVESPTPLYLSPFLSQHELSQRIDQWKKQNNLDALPLPSDFDYLTMKFRNSKEPGQPPLFGNLNISAQPLGTPEDITNPTVKAMMSVMQDFTLSKESVATLAHAAADVVAEIAIPPIAGSGWMALLPAVSTPDEDKRHLLSDENPLYYHSSTGWVGAEDKPDETESVETLATRSTLKQNILHTPDPLVFGNQLVRSAYLRVTQTLNYASATPPKHDGTPSLLWVVALQHRFWSSSVKQLPSDFNQNLLDSMFIHEFKTRMSSHDKTKNDSAVEEQMNTEQTLPQGLQRIQRTNPIANNNTYGLNSLNHVFKDYSLMETFWSQVVALLEQRASVSCSSETTKGYLETVRVLFETSPQIDHRVLPTLHSSSHFPLGNRVFISNALIGALTCAPVTAADLALSMCEKKAPIVEPDFLLAADMMNFPDTKKEPKTIAETEEGWNDDTIALPSYSAAVIDKRTNPGYYKVIFNLIKNHVLQFIRSGFYTYRNGVCIGLDGASAPAILSVLHELDSFMSSHYPNHVVRESNKGQKKVFSAKDDKSPHFPILSVVPRFLRILAMNQAFPQVLAVNPDEVMEMYLSLIGGMTDFPVIYRAFPRLPHFGELTFPPSIYPPPDIGEEENEQANSTIPPPLLGPFLSTLTVGREHISALVPDRQNQSHGSDLADKPKTEFLTRLLDCIGAVAGLSHALTLGFVPPKSLMIHPPKVLMDGITERARLEIKQEDAGKILTETGEKKRIRAPQGEQQVIQSMMYEEDLNDVGLRSITAPTDLSLIQEWYWNISARSQPFNQYGNPFDSLSIYPPTTEVCEEGKPLSLVSATLASVMSGTQFGLEPSLSEPQLNINTEPFRIPQGTVNPVLVAYPASSEVFTPYLSSTAFVESQGLEEIHSKGEHPDHILQPWTPFMVGTKTAHNRKEGSAILATESPVLTVYVGSVLESTPVSTMSKGLLQALSHFSVSYRVELLRMSMNLAGYGFCNESFDSIDQEARKEVMSITEDHLLKNVMENRDVGQQYYRLLNGLRVLAHGSTSHLLRLLDPRLPQILESNGIIPWFFPIGNTVQDKTIDKTTFNAEQSMLRERTNQLKSILENERMRRRYENPDPSKIRVPITLALFADVNYYDDEDLQMEDNPVAQNSSDVAPTRLQNTTGPASSDVLPSALLKRREQKRVATYPVQTILQAELSYYVLTNQATQNDPSEAPSPAPNAQQSAAADTQAEGQTDKPEEPGQQKISFQLTTYRPEPKKDGPPSRKGLLPPFHPLLISHQSLLFFSMAEASQMMANECRTAQAVFPFYLSASSEERKTLQSISEEHKAKSLHRDVSHALPTVPFLSLLLNYYPKAMFTTMMNDAFAYGLPRGLFYRVRFLRYLCQEWDPSDYTLNDYSISISATLAFALLHLMSGLTEVRLAAYIIIRKSLRAVLHGIETGILQTKPAHSLGDDDSRYYDPIRILKALHLLSRNRFALLSTTVPDALRNTALPISEVLAHALKPIALNVIQWISMHLEKMTVFMHQDKWLETDPNHFYNATDSVNTATAYLDMQFDINYSTHSLPRILAEADTPMLVAQSGVYLIVPWIEESNLITSDFQTRNHFLELLVTLVRARLLNTNRTLVELNDEVHDSTQDASFATLVSSRGGAGSLVSSIMGASAHLLIANTHRLPFIPDLRQGNHASSDPLLESYLVVWARLAFTQGNAPLVKKAGKSSLYGSRKLISLNNASLAGFSSFITQSSTTDDDAPKSNILLSTATRSSGSLLPVWHILEYLLRIHPAATLENIALIFSPTTWKAFHGFQRATILEIRRRFQGKTTQTDVYKTNPAAEGSEAALVGSEMNIALEVADPARKRAQLEKVKMLSLQQTRQFVFGRTIMSNMVAGYINSDISAIIPYVPALFSFSLTHCSLSHSVLLQTGSPENYSAQVPNSTVLAAFGQGAQSTVLPSQTIPATIRLLLMRLLDVLVLYRPASLAAEWSQPYYDEDYKSYTSTPLYRSMFQNAHALLARISSEFGRNNTSEDPWPIDWRWDSSYFPSFAATSAEQDKVEQSMTGRASVHGKKKDKNAKVQTDTDEQGNSPLSPDQLFHALDVSQPIPIALLVHAIVILLFHSPNAIATFTRTIVQWATAFESPAVTVSALRVYRALLISLNYMASTLGKFAPKSEDTIPKGKNPYPSDVPKEMLDMVNEQISEELRRTAPAAGEEEAKEKAPPPQEPSPLPQKSKTPEEKEDEEAEIDSAEVKIETPRTCFVRLTDITNIVTLLATPASLVDTSSLPSHGMKKEHLPPYTVTSANWSSPHVIKQVLLVCETLFMNGILDNPLLLDCGYYLDSSRRKTPLGQRLAENILFLKESTIVLPFMILSHPDPSVSAQALSAVYHSLTSKCKPTQEMVRLMSHRNPPYELMDKFNPKELRKQDLKFLPSRFNSSWRFFGIQPKYNFSLLNGDHAEKFPIAVLPNSLLRDFFSFRSRRDYYYPLSQSPVFNIEREIGFDSYTSIRPRGYTEPILRLMNEADRYGSGLFQYVTKDTVEVLDPSRQPITRQEGNMIITGTDASSYIKRKVPSSDPDEVPADTMAILRRMVVFNFGNIPAVLPSENDYNALRLNEHNLSVRPPPFPGLLPMLLRAMSVRPTLLHASFSMTFDADDPPEEFTTAVQNSLKEYKHTFTTTSIVQPLNTPQVLVNPQFSGNVTVGQQSAALADNTLPTASPASLADSHGYDGDLVYELKQPHMFFKVKRETKLSLSATTPEEVAVPSVYRTLSAYNNAVLAKKSLVRGAVVGGYATQAQAIKSLLIMEGMNADVIKSQQGLLGLTKAGQSSTAMLQYNYFSSNPLFNLDSETGSSVGSIAPINTKTAQTSSMPSQLTAALSVRPPDSSVSFPRVPNMQGEARKDFKTAAPSLVALQCIAILINPKFDPAFIINPEHYGTNHVYSFLDQSLTSFWQTWLYNFLTCMFAIIPILHASLRQERRWRFETVARRIVTGRGGAVLSQFDEGLLFPEEQTDLILFQKEKESITNDGSMSGVPLLSSSAQYLGYRIADPATQNEIDRGRQFDSFGSQTLIDRDEVWSVQYFLEYLEMVLDQIISMRSDLPRTISYITKSCVNMISKVKANNLLVSDPDQMLIDFVESVGPYFIEMVIVCQQYYVSATEVTYRDLIKDETKIGVFTNARVITDRAKLNDYNEVQIPHAHLFHKDESLYSSRSALNFLDTIPLLFSISPALWGYSTVTLARLLLDYGYRYSTLFVSRSYLVAEAFASIVDKSAEYCFGVTSLTSNLDTRPPALLHATTLLIQSYKTLETGQLFLPHLLTSPVEKNITELMPKPPAPQEEKKEEEKKDEAKKDEVKKRQAQTPLEKARPMEPLAALSVMPPDFVTVARHSSDYNTFSLPQAALPMHLRIVTQLQRAAMALNVVMERTFNQLPIPCPEPSRRLVLTPYTEEERPQAPPPKERPEYPDDYDAIHKKLDPIEERCDQTMRRLIRKYPRIRILDIENVPFVLDRPYRARPAVKWITPSPGKDSEIHDIHFAPPTLVGVLNNEEYSTCASFLYQCNLVTIPYFLQIGRQSQSSQNRRKGKSSFVGTAGMRWLENVNTSSADLTEAEREQICALVTADLEPQHTADLEAKDEEPILDAELLRIQRDVKYLEKQAREMQKKETQLDKQHKKEMDTMLQEEKKRALAHERLLLDNKQIVENKRKAITTLEKEVAEAKKIKERAEAELNQAKREKTKVDKELELLEQKEKAMEEKMKVAHAEYYRLEEELERARAEYSVYNQHFPEDLLSKSLNARGTLSVRDAQEFIDLVFQDPNHLMLRFTTFIHDYFSLTPWEFFVAGLDYESSFSKPNAMMIANRFFPDPDFPPAEGTIPAAEPPLNMPASIREPLIKQLKEVRASQDMPSKSMYQAALLHVFDALRLVVIPSFFMSESFRQYTSWRMKKTNVKPDEDEMLSFKGLTPDAVQTRIDAYLSRIEQEHIAQLEKELKNAEASEKSKEEERKRSVSKIHAQESQRSAAEKAEAERKRLDALKKAEEDKQRMLQKQKEEQERQDRLAEEKRRKAEARQEEARRKQQEEFENELAMLKGSFDEEDPRKRKKKVVAEKPEKKEEKAEEPPTTLNDDDMF